MERIHVSGPWITEKEVQYVADAAENAWQSEANIYHERFEQLFAEYLGVQFAIALPSCTSAIHLALLALGIGPGDEVIVPEITWIATAAPISYVGATPVFADIDPYTWCLSAESFKNKMTPKTKAVIPVDLYGGSADWDDILSVSRKNNIAVIEDAAQAIGTEYKGKKAGSFGDVGVFSFHGSKTLTTGEGGMFVTNNETIHRRALFLRDHGRNPGDTLFFNTEIAYKYKMSSMQAAMGVAQLERIDELIGRKRDTFDLYRKELSDVNNLTLNYEAKDVKNSYWMVTIILDEKLGIDKYRLIALMKERNIDCRPFFHPLSVLPAYACLGGAKQAEVQNPVSYRISPYGVNLPSGLSMTEEKVKYVCDTLIDILNI
jgi:perosamine synthetase